ncbi:MAG: fused MFS/spermidine synthase [Candidatus Rokuibacteriota bacterium]
MLQSWFAGAGGSSTREPYHLYAASNLGSLAALLAYPVWIEPHLRLPAQGWLWTLGYAGLGVLIAACAARVLQSSRGADHGEPKACAPNARSAPTTTSPGKGPVLQALGWIAWAFVPSSLMLGVTTYLTTEIVAVPLLWVIPLAIYLLTYVLAFGVMSPRVHQLAVLAMPVAVVLILFVTLSRIAPPLAFVTVLHLGTLFLVGMVGHGKLVRSRPETRALTTFYLCLALGGALGGLLHAVVAPVVFPAIVEYPLTLVLACLLLPAVGASEQTSGWARGLDVAVPLALGGIAAGLRLALPAGGLDPSGPDTLLGLRSGQLSRILVGLPAVLSYLLVGRPLRFGLAVGAILLAAALATDLHDPVVRRERSFFGVHQIRHDRERNELRLYHGTTVHGMQSLDPTRRQEPLAYYHPTGPIGQVFAGLRTEGRRPSVAIIGLGAGALAAYGAPDQPITFYEIDPVVERLARDPRYFTYRQDAEARGVKLTVALGDARLRLAHARDQEYGLVVVDAFSSHAIPTHLLTREALGLNLAKLTGDGLLAFHLSNPHLRLERVLGALAREAGLVALLQDDPSEERLGKAASRWAILARRQADFGGLARDPRWRALLAPSAIRAWTDDFSNVLGVLK